MIQLKVVVLTSAVVFLERTVHAPGNAVKRSRTALPRIAVIAHRPSIASVPRLAAIKPQEDVALQRREGNL